MPSVSFSMPYFLILQGRKKKNKEKKGENKEAARQIHKAHTTSGAITSFSLLGFFFFPMCTSFPSPGYIPGFVAVPRTALMNTPFMPVDCQSTCLKPIKKYLE